MRAWVVLESSGVMVVIIYRVWFEVKGHTFRGHDLSLVVARLGGWRSRLPSDRYCVYLHMVIKRKVMVADALFP